MRFDARENFAKRPLYAIDRTCDFGDLPLIGRWEGIESDHLKGVADVVVHLVDNREPFQDAFSFFAFVKEELVKQGGGEDPKSDIKDYGSGHRPEPLLVHKEKVEAKSEEAHGYPEKNCRNQNIRVCGERT